ncbi:MAG: hypothetical protein GWO20_16500 [Candidatus Korarchaeota archaeon]|nr:hypothetical protein [Candidatus Korarchaeota archaeon]NIU85005.1 hypothetical protein [Candidatus Thorarchaeota archaeon]NIW15030.1 hypothetical protein [Candidatus Thorarchaeota archaeon]NIW53040.1 hypothetical protein [Candidatus Korarchaeota archaeon]
MSDEEIEESIEEEEVVEEKRRAEEKGLVIILEERQDGSKDHKGEQKTLKNKGKLTIENRTGGPIYDFEIYLTAIDDTDLKTKLEEPYLKAFEESGKEIPYTITEKDFMCMLTEELNFKEGLVTPVAIFNRDTPLNVNLSLKNKTNGPLSVKLSKDLPKKMKIATLPSTDKGDLSKNGELRWTVPSLAPEEETNVSIDATILSKDPEAFKSGKIKYKSKGDGFTISGVKVDKVKAGAIERITETTEKKERMEERGIWDARIYVENRSNTTVKAMGKIGVMSGEIIGAGEEEAEQLPGRVESPIPGKREYPQLVSDPVSIEPGKEQVIGPFPIQSEEEPRLTFDVAYEVVPEVIKRAAGTYEVEDTSIPCLNSKVTKEVEVKHPPAATGLSATELMSNLEEPVEIKVQLENTGSAEIDYCELTEVIPEGFTPPRKGEIEALLRIGDVEGIEVPEDNLQVEITPKDPVEENTLRLTVSDISKVFDSSMRKGDILSVKYQVTALSPEAEKNYKFSSIGRVALSTADKPTDFELKEVPVLSTVKIRREIRKRKQITPGAGEKEFVVTAILKNDGTLPAEEYEFTDMIPSNFEFIQESAEPQPTRTQEIPGGVKIRWTLDEIPPDGEETVEYTVRGLTGFKVSELKKIRE